MIVFLNGWRAYIFRLSPSIRTLGWDKSILEQFCSPTWSMQLRYMHHICLKLSCKTRTKFLTQTNIFEFLYLCHPMSETLDILVWNIKGCKDIEKKIFEFVAKTQFL